MKFSIFIFFILLSTPSFAHLLEGDYQLTKGDSACPTGEIVIIKNKLLFGARHVWDFGLKNLEESKEAVEGGCQYLTKTNKSDNQFSITTKRMSCPNESENGQTIETLLLKKVELTYTSVLIDQNNKKTILVCIYKKSEKK